MLFPGRGPDGGRPGPALHSLGQRRDEVPHLGMFGLESRFQAVLAEANTEIRKGRMLAILPGLGAILALICFGPALLGWFVSWKVGLASVFGLIAGFAMVGAANGTTIKEEASWNVTPLVGYRSPVPKQVLQTAVRLKKKLPGVQLTVHELVQSERVLDPFLAARLGETTYFIAVWDEPKFDAQSV